MMNVKNILKAALAAATLSGAVFAASSGEHPKQVDWSFTGMFGDYDKQSAQRGWQTFREVCSSCHSLKYFRFRNLDKLGYSDDMIKAFAAEYTVAGEPDEDGLETERKALPQDAFPSPFANDNAARAANGGALPPDLSLMVKARHDGANYVYSLLTGYSENIPEGVNIPTGKYYNPYFPGGAISMAPPITDDLIEFQDGTAVTHDQLAKDITMFLAYVAEPSLGERHDIGRGVLLFLIILSFMLYFANKRLWKPVKEGKTLWHDE